MKYAYFPGCSLTSSARDYDETVRLTMNLLGVELETLEDWNCCGASAAPSVEPDLGVALSARNLALAEAEGRDVATACAFCYTALRRARETVLGKTPAGERARASLADIGRKVTGASQVRHVLEIILDDVGLEAVRQRVIRPLTGLKVAAYYGCQLGRPEGGFVHPELPTELDSLVEALGATPVDWTGKTRCCGSSVMMTHEDAALGLSDRIIASAERGGAQLIATACPLCQMNLDAYQSRMPRQHDMPVVYFTQLMGVAFGLAPERLGFDLAFVPAEPVLAPFLSGVRR